MAYLKVYEWERQRWPDFQTIDLSRWQQEQVVAYLSRQFGVSQPAIGQSYKAGASKGEAGAYFREARKFDWIGDIGTGPIITVGTKCKLGVLVHEFAHHLNNEWHPKEARTRRHGKTFKKCLRTCYSKARKFKKLWG